MFEYSLLEEYIYIWRCSYNSGCIIYRARRTSWLMPDEADATVAPLEADHDGWAGAGMLSDVSWQVGSDRCWCWMMGSRWPQEWIAVLLAGYILIGCCIPWCWCFSSYAIWLLTAKLKRIKSHWLLSKYGVFLTVSLFISLRNYLFSIWIQYSLFGLLNSVFA